MRLSEDEQAIAAGGQGEAAAMAMRLVVESGRLLGADRRRRPLEPLFPFIHRTCGC